MNINKNYDLIFSDNGLGAITNYYGVLTDKILIECTRKRYSSPDRNKKLRYIINDYTECSGIEVSTEAVINVAMIAIEIAQNNRGIVIAAAMPSDLAFGLGRMWQAYADETGWKSHAFRAREEAENWVQNELQQKLKFCP